MKINDSTLIYDINKICNFVFGDPNDRSNEVEISQSFVYDEDGKPIPNAKEVKEVKANDYTGQSTIRYDLIRNFIDILESIEDYDLMTLGQKITLNTMESYELIKDIKDLEQ